MSAVFFFLGAIGAIAGAIGVVALRNPFYNVLSLVCHLISLAALFLLLRAEFVAAAQVIVYAGAVMVLYVFVVAYIGGADEPLRGPDGALMRLGAIVFSIAILGELCIAVLGSGLKALDSRGAGYEPGFGSPEAIGQLLLTRFLFPFEAASFLLLMAAVGAVVLAKRRGGLHSDAEARLSALEFLRRPQGTGTLAEGVSGAPQAPTSATPPALERETTGGPAR